MSSLPSTEHQVVAGEAVHDVASSVAIEDVVAVGTANISHDEKSFPRLGAAEVPGVMPGDGGSAVALLLGMSCRTLAEYFLCSCSVSMDTLTWQANVSR